MLQNEVEVIEIRAFTSNSMLAFIDVRIDFIVVFGAKIMKRESGENWLAWPSVEKEGKFYDTVGIDSRTAEKEIKAEVIRQYQQKTKAPGDAFGDSATVKGSPQGFVLPAEAPLDAF